MGAHSIEDLSAADFDEVMWAWNRSPGTVSRGVRFLVAVGFVATLLLLTLAIELYCFATEGAHSTTTVLLYQLPTFVLLLVFLRVHRNQSALSLSLRLACGIPLLHILLVIVATLLWKTDALRVYSAMIGDPSWPLGAIVISGALLVLLGRGGQHMQGQMPLLGPLAITQLIFTLLLGMWLPLASSLYLLFDFLPLSPFG